MTTTDESNQSPFEQRSTRCFHAQKKPIPCKVEFLTRQETILTLEGPVSAGPDQVVLTGVKGERWPIPKSRFHTHYEYDPETQTCVKIPEIVFVERMTEPFEVQVSWSDDSLKGLPGDYRVQYPDGSTGVVRADIFNETYDRVPGLGFSHHKSVSNSEDL